MKLAKLIKPFFSKKSFKETDEHSSISIGFACGYHGTSGASLAIANIANGLSEIYDVEFETKVDSSYSLHLKEDIKKVDAISEFHDIYIFDLRVAPQLVARLKSLGKFIIVSIHGYKPPPASKYFSEGRLKEIIELADEIHFVADVQQSNFQLPSEKFFVIPNCVDPVTKAVFTNNIGVVGNLNKPFKNAVTSVNLGLKSNCDEIHLWSIDSVICEDKRVVHHKWENDRNKIYNSFDVLVYFSEREALSLAVIESLSAGNPCVLADKDYFTPFSTCPGVELVDANNSEMAHNIINDLIAKKEVLRSSIIAHYQKHYAPVVVNQQWHKKVASLELRLKTHK